MARVTATKKVSSPDDWALDLSDFLPDELRDLDESQTEIPRIARTPELTRLVEASVQHVPTKHVLHLGDAQSRPLQPT